MNVKKIISAVLSIVLTISIANICMASDVTGNNLVLNGSFEGGLDNWENWEGSYAVTSDTFHSGENSVKIWATRSGGNEQMLQNVKVDPSGTYNFSAWVRVPSNQSVKVSLLLSSAGYSQETLFTSQIDYTETEKDPYFIPNKVNGESGDGHTLWREIKGTVKIPEEESFPNYDANDESTYPNLCIYFQYVTGGNWNRYVYIDDVKLERVYSKNEFVHSVEFYQDGVNITDIGFVTGTVIVNINVDDIRIDGHSPYIVVAAYRGDKLLGYNCQTVTHTMNDDGTINLTADIEITSNTTAVSGCAISAFVWSDMDSMISLSDTYTIDCIGA